MVVDDHLGCQWFQILMVIGLGIHHHDAVEASNIQAFQGDQGRLDQANHGQIVGTLDFIDIANGDNGGFAPQQPFDGHGAGDGVWIGVDGDQDTVVALELFVKALDFVHRCHADEILMIRSWLASSDGNTPYLLQVVLTTPQE